MSKVVIYRPFDPRMGIKLVAYEDVWKTWIIPVLSGCYYSATIFDKNKTVPIHFYRPTMIGTREIAPRTCCATFYLYDESLQFIKRMIARPVYILKKFSINPNNQHFGGLYIVA